MREVRSVGGSLLRLINLADVLGLLGFWLYKGAARRTLSFGLMFLSLFLLGQRTDAVQLSWQSALSGTGLILLLSCLGGLTLMSISGSMSRAILLRSEAKAANLIEDMKKARAPQHARRLWKRVYRLESPGFEPRALATEPELVRELLPLARRAALPHAADPLSEEQSERLRSGLSRLGATAEGFALLFEHIRLTPLPRVVLSYDFAFDLSMVKDWYDGAPFHPSDLQLFEHYHGSEDLLAAQRLAPAGFWRSLNHKRSRAAQRIWFRVITRAIQLRVAAAVVRMDRDHPPFHFSPDLFFWPTPRTLEPLRRQMGQAVVDELVTLRRRVFHRVLHSEQDFALRLLHRAIYPNFAFATALRRAFDPQYVLARLDTGYADDLRDYDRALESDGPAYDDTPQHVRLRTASEQAALDRWLDAHDGALPAAPHEAFLARRACEIAVHLNLDGLADALTSTPQTGFPQASQPPPRRRRRTPPINPHEALADAIADAPRLNRLLRAVRLHHELTRLELEDYEDYLQHMLA